jgi:hypothetical protein
MGRDVLAVVLGLVLAVLLVFCIEMLGYFVYPPPPEMKWDDAQALMDFVAAAPASVFLIVLTAWVVAAFARAWLAGCISVRAKHPCALIIGALILAFSIQNMRTLPHPLWVWVLAFVLIPPAALAGGALPMRRQPAVPSP